MTTMGLMILLAFIGLFVYAGIRLVPVYLENTKISRTLAQVEEEYTGQQVTKREIETSIYKRFDIEAVNVISTKDLKFERTEGGYIVRADYVNMVPFIANIKFAVEFENEAVIRR